MIPVFSINYFKQKLVQWYFNLYDTRHYILTVPNESDSEYYI